MRRLTGRIARALLHHDGPQRLALLATVLVGLGCPTPGDYVHVDGAHTAGPWDGTEKHPYPTIQKGLNEAGVKQKKGVLVHGGTYNENVVLPVDLALRRADGSKTVVVHGKATSPTITAKSRNYIGDLVVSGGSVGIRIEIGAAATAYDQTLTLIIGNRIESPHGIHVETSKNLAFGAKNRKKPWVAITDNWIVSGTPAKGTGIRVDLHGPKTGELGLRVDISGNIVENKFTGIALRARGQGPNPGGIVRANLTGEVSNNLVLGSSASGLRMDSENLGDAAVLVFGNTVVYGDHGIVATAQSGPDGGASTHANVTNNVIAFNKQLGYLEGDPKTSPSQLQSNIFFKNGSGHYFDVDTNAFVTSSPGLNTPLVKGKVVFQSGGGNLVADPSFEKGVLHWGGQTWGSEKAGEFFLIQTGKKKSPGVDGGFGSAQMGGVSKRSTSVDYKDDVGKADIGFHYSKT